MSSEYNNFSEFYPFYLSQHENRTCRRLHFIGSALIVLLVLYSALAAQWSLLWCLPLVGYGFA